MSSNYMNSCVLSPCKNELATAWKENSGQSLKFLGQYINNTT